MTAPVFTPASNGRMTMEEYGEGCYVTAESILETRRALHVNPAGQLWERLAERDVRARGEPVELDTRWDEWVQRGTRSPILGYPDVSRWFIAIQIERRRPDMRAVRKGAA